MPHQTPLISTIVLGLVLAFILAAVAQRFRISPLVGYLLAGVIIGPATPGFVADQQLANELAEIGVILLMFGVGLHFSLKDLWSVRAIALPGAVAQIAVATLLGWGLGALLGWDNAAGLVFGLTLSTASTVVLLRAMQERRLIETERGRIAVGWLIVEDIAMVLTLVMLPALTPILKAGATSGASAMDLLEPLLFTLGKVIAFVVLMLVAGRRLVPWLLHAIAHTGSRELFRLSVLAVALGVAFFAASLFGVSFALGAFFAGMVMSESELSQRAANETLPLRDAFAVLFFVSVGMLFDPMIIVREPLPMLATLLIIVFGKSIAAFLIVRLFRRPTATALTISASLAQIGEFSFILAGLGVSLGLLPERGRDLILGGAILSILLNPLTFAVLDRWLSRGKGASPAAAPAEPQADTVAPEHAAAPAAPSAAREPIPMTPLTNHLVLVGHGRVGRFIASALALRDPAGKDCPVLIVEHDGDVVAKLQAEGKAALAGNAADPELLHATNLPAARCLIVAIPDAFESGNVVQQARQINPGLTIIARAHSDEEIEHLRKHGANAVVMGENEIARAMLQLIPGSSSAPASSSGESSGPAPDPASPTAA